MGKHGLQNASGVEEAARGPQAAAILPLDMNRVGRLSLHTVTHTLELFSESQAGLDIQVKLR